MCCVCSSAAASAGWKLALPDKEEEPGKPDKGLSPRGFGTAQRTDPVYLGFRKRVCSIRR